MKKTTILCTALFSLLVCVESKSSPFPIYREKVLQNSSACSCESKEGSNNSNSPVSCTAYVEVGGTKVKITVEGYGMDCSIKLSELIEALK